MNRSSADLGFVTLGLPPSVFAPLCAIAVVLMSNPAFGLMIDATRASGERVDLIEPLYKILCHAFPNHDLFVNPGVVEQPRKVGRIFQEGHPDFPFDRSRGMARLFFELGDETTG